MDRQLKQRVVGAAIIVVLGVIFIPIFLDSGSIETQVPDVAKLPPAPPIEQFTSRIVPLEDEDIEQLQAEASEDLPPLEPIVAEQPEAVVTEEIKVPPAEVAPVPSPTPSPNAAVKKAAPEAPLADVSEEIAVPRASLEAWTVQVGSFADNNNARGLIKRLRDDGFPAYLERAVDNTTTTFKVRVGPQVSRAAAKSVAAELESKQKIKGLVMRYRGS